MKTYMKRMKASADVVGLVQEEHRLDMREVEVAIGRKLIDAVSAEWPESLMVVVNVQIDGSVMLDADAAGGGK